MGLEENKAASRRVLETINRHDIDGLKEVMTAPFVDDFKQELAVVIAAFPDYQAEHQELIAEGNKVVTRFIGRGTHQGEFMGVAPTGKQITFNGVSIDSIVDGKLSESFIIMGWLSILQQLGATTVPAPNPA